MQLKKVLRQLIITYKALYRKGNRWHLKFLNSWSFPGVSEEKTIFKEFSKELAENFGFSRIFDEFSMNFPWLGTLHYILTYYSQNASPHPENKW